MTRHCFYIPNKTIKETLIHCISVKENIVNCDRERVGKGVSIFQNRISLNKREMSIIYLRNRIICDSNIYLIKRVEKLRKKLTLLIKYIIIVICNIFQNRISLKLLFSLPFRLHALNLH